MDKFKFIDLFCGIGGFHQAMADLGGECVYASDIDADCRKHMKETTESNLMEISQSQRGRIPEHDVLAADSLARHSQRPVRD